MELTGSWYLKKVLFNYIVMVEVKTKHTCQVFYKKGNRDDIARLNINCN
jgi:hypothetical protein